MAVLDPLGEIMSRYQCDKALRVAAKVLKHDEIVVLLALVADMGEDGQEEGWGAAVLGYAAGLR